MTPTQFLSLSKKVSLAVRSATECEPFDESEPPKYFCTSWRIRGRRSRELFFECFQDHDSTLKVRVGLYFEDSPALITSTPSQAAALRSLRAQRGVLKRLGVVPTFSHHGLDHEAFKWTDADLRKWLRGKSDHRDLVVSWKHFNFDYDVKRVSRILTALVPVWRVWNDVSLKRSTRSAEEGGLREVVVELRQRNSELAQAARAHHGQTCQACFVDLQLVYGPRGLDAVEVHHKIPIGSGKRVNTVNDLACVCPNCHRIIHRQTPMLSIPALRKLIAQNRKRSTKS